MAKREAKTLGTALTRPPSRATMDGLENAVAGMGGLRDKMSYGSWEAGRILIQRELENMYRYSWLAGKIIDIPAEDMTREWRTISLDKDDGTLTKKYEDAERRFNIREKVKEAIQWARLYGGALIVIGTRDGMRDPSTPLVPESIKPGDLKYLHVLDRWRVAPTGLLTKDITSPNFGLPEAYMIAGSSVVVHHTRVLRFNGTKLPYLSWLQNGHWDDPIMNRVMDALAGRETSTKAVATMMFEANVDVIKGAEISNILAQKDGEAKLVRRFQTAMLMKSFNRTLLLDSTEEYEKKSNQFANLDKIMAEFMNDVSGAADIPVTRLFGQTPGGLGATGESDIRNYYDKIRNDQKSKLRPQLEQLDQILYRSEIGGEPPEDFTFEFGSLWQTSDLEESTIQMNQATADGVYLTNGVLHAGNVAKELMARGTYTTLTDADVDLVNELAEPVPGDTSDPTVGFRSPKAQTPGADPNAEEDDPAKAKTKPGEDPKAPKEGDKK